MPARSRDFLLREYAAGRRTVLIVDEAQNVSDDGLEALRLLTNINSGSDALLLLVLVGQPELRVRLQRPHLRQIAQRVGAACHLDRMTADETRDYIRFRLRVAGGEDTLFDDAAIRRIHTEAAGIPRLVNSLCDLCLVGAFAEGIHRITDPFTFAVLREARSQGLLTILDGPAADDTRVSLKLIDAPPSDPAPQFETPPNTRPRLRVAASGAALARTPAPEDLGEPFTETLRRSEPVELRSPAPTTTPLTAAITENDTPAKEDDEAFPGPAASEQAEAPDKAGDSDMPGSEAAAGSKPRHIPKLALLAAAALLALPISMVLLAPDIQSPSAITRADETATLEVVQSDEAGAELLFRQAVDTALADPAGAAILYARAGALGHRRAAAYLAQMYETGDGVPLNPALARLWYTRAGTGIRGVAERLAALASPAREGQGTVTPVFAQRVSARVLDLVWTAGSDAAPAAFRVQLADDMPDGASAELTVPATAVRLVAPPDLTRWRVVPLGADGSAGAYSAWSAVTSDSAPGKS